VFLSIQNFQHFFSHEGKGLSDASAGRFSRQKHRGGLDFGARGLDPWVVSTLRACEAVERKGGVGPSAVSRRRDESPSE
jgi:hypothetical protein